MKNIVAFLFLIFCLSSASAQSHFEDLKSGNYAAIANKMANEVSVQIDRNNKNVPKDRAIQLIRGKLNTFKPTEWKVLHSGASEASGGKYMIASLKNEAGDSIRVFLQVQKTVDGPRISSIRIRQAL